MLFGHSVNNKLQSFLFVKLLVYLLIWSFGEMIIQWNDIWVKWYYPRCELFAPDNNTHWPLAISLSLLSFLLSRLPLIRLSRCLFDSRDCFRYTFISLRTMRYWEVVNVFFIKSITASFPPPTFHDFALQLSYNYRNRKNNGLVGHFAETTTVEW